MAGIIGKNAIIQIGLVVKDIETTKRKFAEFLGIPVPPTIGGGEFEITQTEYMGKPAPDANCRMAFFDIEGSAQLELIEPNEAPSVWRDFLDNHGEGLHHIAFAVKGMKEKIDICEDFGMRLAQKGEYGDGSGRYAYLDAFKDLKILVELLESDER